MSPIVRSSALALGCFLVASTGPACAPAEDVEERPVSVAPRTGSLDIAIADPYDPDSTACPTTSALKETQKHISAIAKAFMTGVWGNKYMLNNPCTGPDGDAAEINLQMATLVGNFVSGSLWFEDSTESANVCGLTAAKKAVRSQDRMVGGIMIHTDVHSAIEELGYQLNLCWGVGHRAFLHLGTQVAQRVWIDPEPVRLTQNLSGSTGATAAGVFVNNTTTAATAVKWYAEGGSGTVAGGTACSTSNVASNTILYKSIVVRPSGFRECL